MKKAKAAHKFLPFVAARYVIDDWAIAECLAAGLEADDPHLLLLTLGAISRARGMAQVAKDVGLGRERLYKACASGAESRFNAMLKGGLGA